LSLPLTATTNSCAADRYGLDELKRLALRKQGLQSGIQISTILASARWAYAHTPDSDSKLRAHYLALIIRSRNTFKRSGTMQMEMEEGGKLFFDLFVAMCNHMVSSCTLFAFPYRIEANHTRYCLPSSRATFLAFQLCYQLWLTIPRMILLQWLDHHLLVKLLLRRSAQSIFHSGNKGTFSILCTSYHTFVYKPTAANLDDGEERRSGMVAWICINMCLISKVSQDGEPQIVRRFSSQFGRQILDQI
jgi:hypothetical protein